MRDAGILAKLRCSCNKAWIRAIVNEQECRMVKRVCGAVDTWPLERLTETACIAPFKTFEIYGDGNVSMCCYSWMPEYAGNILEDGPLAILTNPFRDSVLQNMRCGIYSHCTDLCPHLNALMTGDQRQHVWSMVPKADLDLRLPEFSYIINFSYDESCNLQCPSCRTI